MYAVTGANGQTGSYVVRALLAHGVPVRAVVRRPEQMSAWQAAGAETVAVDLADEAALADAFAGAKGVYLMNPPAYNAPDIFSAAAAVHAAEIAAAERASVEHIVALSSVGAQHAEGTGNILTTHDLERRLARTPIATSILRAANFMENWAWSMPQVAETGILPTMFAPVARSLPMVSVADIGRTAADLLLQESDAPSLVELHGPRDYSPQDAANVLSRLLGRAVRVEATPEAEWDAVFRASGFSPSATNAFCAMYRGFNDGLVAFDGEGTTLHGGTTLADALASAAAT